MENYEIWKDIKGYDGYQVSNLGRVWSVRSQSYLKGGINHGGYRSIQMRANNGKYKREYVHRLVALTFIPNPIGYPEVNHKDENKLNNTVENLEWCSHTYNNNYGTKIQRQTQNHNYPKLGRHPAARKVQCIELDIIYDCAKSASLDLGINNSDIGKACKGKLKTAGGYHWRYADD